jgi:hypothetical protein
VPSTSPLPPPLPPAERTVGQLVAETIRVYGAHFWSALPLGLPLAVVDVLARRHVAAGGLLLLVAAPFLAFGYALAVRIVVGVQPSRATLAKAVALGSVVFVPAALLFTWFALLAVAYLALVGLVVPVAVVEELRPLAAFRRASELARADYVHAVGSLAALVIVFFLSRTVLVALLQGQAENTIDVAAFLADTVLSPLLLLGAAFLYVDEAARVGSRRSELRQRRAGRRRNADLHPPVDLDAAGRTDPQVEP